MNKVVTSREELLDTARQIVFQEGIDQLSIRTLAKKQNISVGAVYNYFPSKADLLLAIVESFWKGIFHKDICTLSETLPFADFYEVVYLRLADIWRISFPFCWANWIYCAIQKKSVESRWRNAISCISARDSFMPYSRTVISRSIFGMIHLRRKPSSIF